METASTENNEIANETITQRITATTLGERLIPLLLLVGEVCVGYAILLSLAVSAHFAGDAEPLLPFWGLLFIMLSFYGSSRVFQRRSPTGLARKVIEPCTWLLLAFCPALFFVWLNNYAQSVSFFSPDWLLALLINFVPVTPGPDQPPGAWVDIHVNITPAIQTVVLLLVAGISGWRGSRLANKHFISDDIDNLFKWGCVLIVLMIGIFLLQFYTGATRLSPQIPALLAAAFCICVLTARALQNVSYMRRFHRAKLWGSAASQERIVWFSMMMLGLMASLLVVLFGNATTGHSTPFLLKNVKTEPGDAHPLHPHIRPPAPFSFPLWLLILILLAVIGLVAYLLWRRSQKLQSFKRSKGTISRAETNDELHETLFNWSLFLAQLWAVLAHLNPFRKRHTSSTENVLDDIHLAEPAVRSIREVYRALLKRAASQGHVRMRNETPYEFWQRLKQQETLSVGPELETITEAYVLARYSASRPDKDTVAHIKQIWSQLKQKWT